MVVIVVLQLPGWTPPTERLTVFDQPILLIYVGGEPALLSCCDWIYVALVRCLFIHVTFGGSCCSPPVDCYVIYCG